MSLKIFKSKCNYSLSPFFPPFLRLKTQFVGKSNTSFCFDKIIFWFFLLFVFQVQKTGKSDLFCQNFKTDFLAKILTKIGGN